MKRNTWMKMLAAMMALCLALACTACGGKGKEATGTAPTTPAEAPKESASEAPKETPAPSPQESATPAPQESAANDGASSDGEGYNMDTLRTALTEGYMGMTEAGEGAYFASNDDGSFVIVAFYDPATNNSVSFVGPGTSPEEGMVTVTDEQNGLALTFSLEDQGDGTILIDMGDIGKALIAPCTVDEVVDALDSISQGSNPLA